MENEMLLSSGRVCEGKDKAPFNRSDRVQIGSEGLYGKMPDYLAALKEAPRRKSAKYKYILHKARALEQRVRKCMYDLRNEKNMTHQYLAMAEVIILVVDRQGNVSFINNKGATTLGRSDREITGKNWLDNFVPEYERERVNTLFLQWIAGETQPAESYETFVIQKDGEERLVEWKSTVLRDKKGEISSILHSGNDITDRKNAEIALLKSAEKIKRFAYFVSHDLKNPAISLIGLTRCLTRRYENVIDEKGKKFCQQIMTKSEQINLLVENINCFVATTELPLCVENFDLKEACCAIKEEFCDRLLSREICFTACNSFPIIRADKLSLIRILRNLIDNSLKYGGHALNTIEIGYMDGRDTHVISVRDNGKGFEEKERKKIFAAFTRNTTSEEAYGTGLGLAIVKELAERHGGSAWAELNRGRGVTFYISISKNLT